MGKFVITKRSNGAFQFVLKAGNGQTILLSEGYSAKASCTQGIASVRNHAPNSSNYDRKTSANGKPYFTLKASNGQIIGSSELYESQAACENGIASVMTNAPSVPVEDLTS
jgi:uncharacterized protein YegP (UPF0339 family)